MQEIQTPIKNDHSSLLESDLEKLDIGLQMEKKADVEPEPEEIPQRKKSWDNDTIYELDSSTDNNVFLKILPSLKIFVALKIS